MIRAWKCDVCGYVHRGDAPPEVCPVCGADQEQFSPFELAPAKPSPASSPTWRCTVCDHVHRGEEAPEACSICGAEKSLFEQHVERDLPGVDVDVNRVIILGAGVAGLTAAEQARASSGQVAITLLSKEPRLPYYRLNLTRFLADEVSEESLRIQGPDWFEAHKIDLHFAEVVGIDRVRQEVRLREGKLLPYDRLILANGAHPFVPPVPGATRESVYTVRTLDDCQAILAGATAGSRCACIGGGLLGLETAGALARRGLEVTILEGFGWLLPRQLAEPAGQLLRNHIEGLGMTVRCGVRVEEIVGDDRARGVRLAEAEVIPADLVVVAAGVRPNSHLARLSGLEVKSGVVVDDRMFTSDPAILAAGDVAEHRGVVYGIWPACYAQAVVAGANAVGGNLEFHGLAPSNRLKVLETDLFSIGQFQPTDASFAVYEGREDGAYYRLVCRDGQLVGANLYGDTSLAGAVKVAIDSGAQLAASPEILDRLPEALRSCQKEHRAR
jgi:nitrite reductase (NADH) large subunit